MKKLIPAFLAVGFGETIGQVLIIRELIIHFQGNELSLGVILANWMLMIGLGSWGFGRLVHRFVPKISIFAATQVLFCLILPAQILFARSANIMTGSGAGQAIGFVPIFYSSLAVVAPLCLLNGFQFVLGSKILAAGKKQPAAEITKIYIAEAAGCMLGGVFFTYILVHYFQSIEIALYAGFINLAAALLLLEPWKTLRLKKPKRPKILVGLVILIMGSGVSMLITGTADSINHVSRQWQFKDQDLAYHRDSVYGNVAITQSDGQFNFYESGLLFSVSPDPDIAFVENIAHFPMLYHDCPRQVLLIGGGLGGVLDEILKHPVEELTYVELDPLLIDIAKQYPAVHALEDPRLRIEYTDGRLFIQQSRQKYDLIIIHLPPPSTLRLNRFYTQEFFLESKNLLKNDGIFSFSLPSSEVYMIKEMVDYNRCIYQSVQEVFPDVFIIAGDHSIFLASSEQDLSRIDIKEIAARFQDRDLNTSLFSVPYLEYMLSSERTERLLSPFLHEGQIETNRDRRPIAVYYNLALWTALFYPGWRAFFEWMQTIQLWWAVIPLILCILGAIALRRKRGAKKTGLWPVALAIASSGFAGMTFSVLFLFVLQISQGSLYQKIGVLLAAFMFGLAIGGLTMNRILYRLKNEILTFIKIEAAMITAAILLPIVLMVSTGRAHMFPPLFPLEILLSFFNCLAGFLVGLQFPLANKIYLGLRPCLHQEIGRTAGTLYGFDLFGGLLGAFLPGVLLIPVLGITQTCFLVAIIKSGSLFMLVVLLANITANNARQD